MKYSKTLGSVALSALLLMGMTGCGSDNDSDETPIIKTDTQAAMVDKSYVPALFYSNISPTPNAMIAGSANTALSTLESQWGVYKEELSTNVNGVDVGSFYADVDTEVSLASDSFDAVITAGNYPADISTAHNSLEEVRDILALMRTALDEEYLMDKVTTAHHKMEAVSGASKLHTDSLISDAELCVSLGESLPLFSTAWDTYSNAYDQEKIATLYGLSQGKSSNLDNNINAMSSIVTALSAALPNCDATVATEAAKIKPTFVKMFLGYADFITPFKAQMIEMEKSLVPLLYCTNNPPDVETTCGGVEGIKTLLNTLSSNSNIFQSQYPIIPGKLNLPGTIYWSTDLTAIKNSIAAAQAIATSATSTDDFKAAHDHAEDIRTSMYHLRWTYENYDFVMDRVADYHHDMEDVLGAGLDATVIEPLLVQAKDDLKLVDDSIDSIDIAAFGFDEAWRTMQKASIVDQRQNLEDMQTAITNADTDSLSTTVTLMKQKFIPFFKTFGAF